MFTSFDGIFLFTLTQFTQFSKFNLIPDSYSCLLSPEYSVYFNMVAVWRWYSRIVDKYPWGSQILQTGVLCAAGDVLAQVIIKIQVLTTTLTGMISYNSWRWRRKVWRSLNFQESEDSSSWALALSALVSGTW